MRRLHFTINLLEDVIFSERSASTGGHATLDYIPGAAFLGYCAGKLYNDIKDQAYNVFHSGKVRFNNAYPLTECDTPTLPIPCCWHLEKGMSIDSHGDKLVNLVHVTKENFDKWEESGIQQKQIRSGYFAQSGCYLIPDRQFRLKTAIDRNKLGRAADSQLFGYESLRAGSRWSFSIDLDEKVDSQLDEKIRGALVDKTFRIGHSRTAEYGLIKVAAWQSVTIVKDGTPDGDLILVYALSDLALRDTQTGAPTLTPDPEAFSLKSAVFAPEKSFLRTRSYAPFNGHRRTFDLERQVIAKGSVLAFQRKEGTFTSTELTNCRTSVAAGIGSYRHDGLGQVLVQPRFLDKDFPIHLTKSNSKAVQATVSTPTDLQTWLTKRTEQLKDEQQTIATVAEWVEALVDKNQNKGELPSNAQWGQLRSIAMNAADAALRDALFHRVPDDSRNSRGFCYHGISEKQWKKTFKFENRTVSYRDFLETTVVGEEADLAKVRTRLYLLANRVPRRVNQLTRKEGK